MGEDNRCRLCGRFMKEIPSRRWEKKYRCTSCGIYTTVGEINHDEWFPKVGKE